MGLYETEMGLERTLEYHDFNPNASPPMGTVTGEVEGPGWLLLRTSIEAHRRGDRGPVVIGNSEARSLYASLSEGGDDA